jgi:hypothetical protein
MARAGACTPPQIVSSHLLGGVAMVSVAGHEESLKTEAQN